MPGLVALPEPPTTEPNVTGFRILAHLPIVGLCFDAGTLRTVIYRGRRWTVAQYEAWHGRAPWWNDAWEPRDRIVVDMPMMRVQVRIGGDRSQLVTLDVMQDRTGEWRIKTVDGSEPSEVR